MVGDAAHGTTPRGATGMNTGIADGHNLGWKLAWVARGWAHEALLDSYQDERGPVGRRNASRSMESRIGSSAESSLAADFGVTYGSAVIAGGQTGELDFEDVGQRARPGESGTPCLGRRTRQAPVDDRSLRRSPDAHDRRRW